MLKPITASICAALVLRATCHAAELTENTAFVSTSATPTPDFDALRIKGYTIALPGPQDTIDPDFAGLRSSLAALGIGYIGYTNNSFYDNMLPAERTTFGQQVYNGQKPTFFTNNVCYLPSVCRSGDRVNPLGEHRLQGSRIATIIASSSMERQSTWLGFLGACREISDGLTLLALRDSLLVDPVALSEGSQALLTILYCSTDCLRRGGAAV
jgi:hypothetical protein